MVRAVISPDAENAVLASSCASNAACALSFQATLLLAAVPLFPRRWCLLHGHRQVTADTQPVSSSLPSGVPPIAASSRSRSLVNSAVPSLLQLRSTMSERSCQMLWGSGMLPTGVSARDRREGEGIR